ncbi:MAG: hypothetical protein AAB432_01120 [Patescibacteria group bacterium]
MKPVVKKIIIVSGAVIIALGIYLLMRALFSSPSSPENQNSTLPISSENGGNQPSAVNSGTQNQTNSLPTLKKISESAVFDFIVRADSKDVYYFGIDGKTYSAKEGPDLSVSSQTMNALNFIEADPTAQKVLAAFGDPQSPSWGIFDFNGKSWHPLPAEILNATWGSSNNELIATVKNGNNLNLSLVDLKNNPPSYKTLIKDFRLKDVKFAFRSPQSLLIFEKGNSTYTSRVWQLDLKTLSLNLLINNERGLVIGFSDDKKNAFGFSLPNKFKIFDNSFQKGILTFFTTLPSKCNNTASTTFCFVPQILPPNQTLPDDYFQKSFRSTDGLYTYNQTTGAFRQILLNGSEITEPLDVYHPQYLGDRFYFINRFDRGLYALNLKID